MNQQQSPADRLEGITLQSGWVIGAKIVRKVGSSGANFGVCYTATRGNEKAFVKAIDFRRALHMPDPIAAIAELTGHMQWEKDVMEFCEQHKLSKIVKLLTHEYVLLDDDKEDLTKRISCLVMEIGDGDLRGDINTTPLRENSWKLMVLRDVALAVDQLHRNGIAHLDVKPSNVITKGNGNGISEMKLGDLGRVVRKGLTGPFDSQTWPGDPAYQPPEKMYGFRSDQWNDEREAADAYLLGSLAVFLFTKLPMTALMHHETPEAYRQNNYRGLFDQSLLDVLTLAQTRVLTIYVGPELPAEIKEEMLELIGELTNPDPRKRGDRKARQRGVVGVDRYHQKWLRMAKRMSIIERLAEA